MQFLIFLIFSFFSFIWAIEDCSPEPVNRVVSDAEIRVAVLGAGVASAAFCHELKQLLPNAQVDVFEASATVGGRVKNVEIEDQGEVVPIEVGGSIWVDVNRHIESVVSSLGVEKVSRKEPLKRKHGKGSFDNGNVGIHNGKEFVFQQSDFKLITIIKALWRYGLASRNVESLTEATLRKFMRLYDDDFEPFEDVEQFMRRLGLFNETQVSLESYLAAHGVGQAYIDEMASAATRVNYGQNTDISAFAGLVTLVAMNHDAFQAQDGNFKLVEALFEASNVSLHFNTPIGRVDTYTKSALSSMAGALNSVVGGAEKVVDGEGKARQEGMLGTLWKMVTGGKDNKEEKRIEEDKEKEKEVEEKKEDEEKTEEKEEKKEKADPLYTVNGHHFDAVAIGFPLELTAATYVDGATAKPLALPATVEQPTRRAYHTTHATLIQTTNSLNPLFFGLKQSEQVPPTVLTSHTSRLTDSERATALPITSVSRLYRCENGTSIYKIFSKQKPSQATLNELFGDEHSVIYHKAWRAYTVLKPSTTTSWRKVKLAEALYDLSAMESVVSTIETQMISGKNAARLLSETMTK